MKPGRKSHHDNFAGYPCQVIRRLSVREGALYFLGAGNVNKRTTVLDIQKMKADGEKISVLTCYDYPTARIMDHCGIDVMLIGDISFRQAVELLHPTQAVLCREVNPKVFSADEFSAKAPTEPFLADVLAKPKLFLIGNAHDLEELARHQP